MKSTAKRQPAEILFTQYETEGAVNPAKIISMFPEEGEASEVAALFNARIHEVEKKSDMEKALKEMKNLP